MDEAEIREFVIQRLSQGVSANDVVLAVCERSGLSWEKAKALVLETALDGEPTIASRQMPLLAVLAAASMVMGAGLIVWFAVGMVEPLVVAKPGRGTAGLFETGALVAWIASNAYFVGDIVVGAGLIAGGYLGLRKAGIRPFASKR